MVTKRMNVACWAHAGEGGCVLEAVLWAFGDVYMVDKSMMTAPGMHMWMP